MNIILDIDGTLIDDKGLLIGRPHLEEFLKYCFENFETVSIWTASSESWYQSVYKYVLKEILDKYNFKFYKVLTGERCTKVVLNFYSLYPTRVSIKPLVKLWKGNNVFTKYNTLIIDNTPNTFQRNYGNGIPIPTFNFSNQTDKYLLKLIKFLDHLKEIYEKKKTIRHEEKRTWYTSINYL